MKILIMSLILCSTLYSNTTINYIDNRKSGVSAILLSSLLWIGITII